MPCNIFCGLKSQVTFITSAEWVGKWCTYTLTKHWQSSTIHWLYK